MIASEFLSSRSGVGFFEDRLLSFLEQRRLPYIVVARLTKWIKREAQRVPTWHPLDEIYSLGEFRVTPLGWESQRRFVVVRELLREEIPTSPKLDSVIAT